MSSVREKVRAGWTPIMIMPKERFAHKADHMALRKWAEENCKADFASTLIRNKGEIGNLSSSFAFEDESDASYFALRWK